MRHHDEVESSPGVVSGLLKLALGAGAVLVAAYAFSRLRQERAAEARLRRLEALVDRLKACPSTGPRTRGTD